jgi:hypothetical protein
MHGTEHPPTDDRRVRPSRGRRAVLTGTIALAATAVLTLTAASTAPRPETLTAARAEAGTTTTTAAPGSGVPMLDDSLVGDLQDLFTAHASEEAVPFARTRPAAPARAVDVPTTTTTTTVPPTTTTTAPPPPPPPPPTTTTTAPPPPPPPTTTTTAPPPPPPPPTTAPPPPPPPPTTAPPPPPPPPTTAAPSTVGANGDPNNPATWDALAQCEATGNWHINTGNGYYGGLQFTLSSWRAAGGSGYPHEHSRETQIEMGKRLLAIQGWGAWPACTSKLGYR